MINSLGLLGANTLKELGPQVLVPARALPAIPGAAEPIPTAWRPEPERPEAATRH